MALEYFVVALEEVPRGFCTHVRLPTHEQNHQAPNLTHKQPKSVNSPQLKV